MIYSPPPIRADLVTVPRRRNAQPEHHIQRAFIKWVDLMCVQYPELALGYAIPNARKGKLDAILRYREGVRSGPADWCLPLPHGLLWRPLDWRADCAIVDVPLHNGLLLEFKAPKGATQKTQRCWLAGVAEAGYRVIQPTTTQQAIDCVSTYLALPARYDVQRVRGYAEQLLEARAALRAKRRTRKGA